MGDIIYTITTWVVPLIFAIVFHEIAHGWVANMLGDPTAARLGRLNPNPVKHVDPVGTVALPLMLAVAGAPVFGWAKPVPVDPNRLRNPRVDMVLVALAGPGINLFMGALSAVALGALIGSAGGEELSFGWMFLAQNLLNFLLINIFLAVFNMLPLPPFDGGAVLAGFLPRHLAAKWAELERYGFLILVMLVLVLPMISPYLNIMRMVVAPIANAITGSFLGGVGLIE